MSEYHKKLKNEIRQLQLQTLALKRIRKEMNINNRDLDVWKRTRDRYLTADVEALQKFIKNYKE